jgi:hypothetical protein
LLSARSQSFAGSIDDRNSEGLDIVKNPDDDEEEEEEPPWDVVLAALASLRLRKTSTSMLAFTLRKSFSDTRPARYCSCTALR